MGKTLTKQFIQKIIFVIIFIMIVFLGINFYQKTAHQKKLEPDIILYHSLMNQNWPYELLDDKFRKLKQKKIIYAYSTNDCEQCTISHLKFLKIVVEQNNQIDEPHIQILGSGESILKTYQKYKKVFRLNFPTFMDTQEVFFEKFQSVSPPLFAILDENNRIIYSWKADPEKILVSDTILKKFF